MFWDVHSHVVPSGDDGAQSREEGLVLCRSAAEHGTTVLYATPHVWPSLRLTPDREEAIREAHAALAAEARTFGLDLRLGFELTPMPSLLDDDMTRFRLGELPAVLMELPFHGSLSLAEALAEHIEGSGFTPVIAHPERAEAVRLDYGVAAELHDRGWLLQANATSLLGRHGTEIEAAAWRLLADGVFDLVSSDGHRATRPPHLDEAFQLVKARVGEAARPLFDGAPLAALAARDGVDLAQRG